MAGCSYLGILLSVVFLFAAVLMIYYKQLSEGYEDQERFEIMQKVGMTRKNVRKQHQLAAADGVLPAAGGRGRCT